MQVVKAPGKYNLNDGFRVFLAGSIEMGKAVDWQHKLQELLAMSSESAKDLILLNPRRDDLDNSWQQDRGDAHFVEQVEWELRGQEWADLIVFYFAPETKSPVTLLELGLAIGRYPNKAIVFCPDDFWRQGNIDVTCVRYGVDRANDLNELAVKTLRRVDEMRKLRLASIWEEL